MITLSLDYYNSLLPQWTDRQIPAVARPELRRTIDRMASETVHGGWAGLTTVRVYILYLLVIFTYLKFVKIAVVKLKSKTCDKFAQS